MGTLLLALDNLYINYLGEKILSACPLTKHGLKVTHIYQVVDYTPVPCFRPFGEAVSDARRAGECNLVRKNQVETSHADRFFRLPIRET